MVELFVCNNGRAQRRLSACNLQKAVPTGSEKKKTSKQQEPPKLRELVEEGPVDLRTQKEVHRVPILISSTQTESEL